jgi:hypothetical protein
MPIRKHLADKTAFGPTAIEAMSKWAAGSGAACPHGPKSGHGGVTDRASGATNCRTDSNLLITVSGSARPIHCPDKFCSNLHHDTG